jgi:hypothetical protein
VKAGKTHPRGLPCCTIYNRKKKKKKRKGQRKKGSTACYFAPGRPCAFSTANHAHTLIIR